MTVRKAYEGIGRKLRNELSEDQWKITSAADPGMLLEGSTIPTGYLYGFGALHFARSYRAPIRWKASLLILVLLLWLKRQVLTETLRDRENINMADWPAFRNLTGCNVTCFLIVCVIRQCPMNTGRKRLFDCRWFENQPGNTVWHFCPRIMKSWKHPTAEEEINWNVWNIARNPIWLYWILWLMPKADGFSIGCHEPEWLDKTAFQLLCHSSEKCAQMPRTCHCQLGASEYINKSVLQGGHTPSHWEYGKKLIPNQKAFGKHE